MYTRIYSNATNLEMEKVIATEIVSPNPESGYNYSVIFGFEKNFDKQVRTSAGMHTDCMKIQREHSGEVT